MGLDKVELYKEYILNKIEDGLEYKKGGLAFEQIDFEHFKVSVNGDGIIDIPSIVRLYDYIQNNISHRLGKLDFIAEYHPNSPKYWKKVEPVENTEDYDDPQIPRYELWVNLEDFMDSKSKRGYADKGLGFYIPDNYELAEIVLSEFKNETGLDITEIGDESYRDIAKLVSTDKGILERFADFIEEKYISKKMSDFMSEFNIKNIIFDGTKVEFEYND